MKHLLYAFIFGCLLTVSCNKKKEIDHAAIAAEAAKHYYENLISGKHELFMKGLNLPDKNFEDFIKRQQKEHKGIKKVSVRSAQFLAKDSMANAYLLLHYGDSTTEQVVVPMLKKHGLWYMR